MISEVSNVVEDIFEQDNITISSSNNNNDNNNDIDDDIDDGILSTLLLILQVGLLLEYLPTHAIINLLSSSTSLLAVNGNYNIYYLLNINYHSHHYHHQGISSSILYRVMHESFEQNSSLSRCTLSTLMSLSELPSLSLKLHDIMIMQVPKISLTVRDLKAAFICIAECSCCFPAKDVPIYATNGPDVDDDSRDADWSVDGADINEFERVVEPEHKTIISFSRLWPLESSSDRQVVLMHNAVRSILRQVGLRQDAITRVITRFNVDTAIENSPVTICPSHCDGCNKIRCDNCFECKICPVCLKTFCKKCLKYYYQVHQRFRCHFCEGFLCDECFSRENPGWLQCDRCLMKICEICDVVPGVLNLRTSCCEKYFCKKCSAKGLEIFKCSTCSYSNCEECTEEWAYNDVNVTKCLKCGDTVCIQCRTAEYCKMCCRIKCMKCYPMLECERCGGCLCVECKEKGGLVDRKGRSLDHVKCSGCQKFTCCERYNLIFNN